MALFNPALGLYPVITLNFVPSSSLAMRGMIAVLATRLSAIGLNIDRIATQNKDVEFTFVDLELQVTSRTHLARVMRRLRTVEGVLKVVRSARR